MSLTITPACDAPREIGALFAEYTQMLIENEPGFRQYPELQNYEDELRHGGKIMYQGFGFYEIPSYNNSPMSNLIYMQLDL